MRQGFARSVVVLMSIAFVASGCTSTARLWTGSTATAEVLPQVKPADRVLLVREGSQDLHCRVTSFDAELVYGCRDPVWLRDIREVRYRKLDGKSVLTLPDLRAGDELTLRMRSGETRRFLLVSVDDGVLRGEDVEVMISEIDRATVVRNPGKPGAAKVVAGIVTVVVVAAAVVAYAMAKALAEDEGE